MRHRAAFRKDLSMPGMLNLARRSFERVEDPVAPRGLTTADCLMAGLAIFSTKSASLLQFDRAARSPTPEGENLRTLFELGRVPCDTQMRERLDRIEPNDLRPAYRRLFAMAQRSGALKGAAWVEGRHVLSVDGTGHFSSPKVHCENCCVKKRRDGSVEYYHQSLCAVLVHQSRRHVLPMVPPEAILKQDGAGKNDCERNAAKRLLTALRREHPHLPLLVVEDGLASNSPHIQLLKSLDMAFLLGAKPGDHKALFEWVDELESAQHPSRIAVHRWETIDEHGFIHRFRWMNDAPLNDSHPDLTVNFLEYWETSPKGKEKHFSWVTDRRLRRGGLMTLMRAGRARWRIENETFNTLKNQGYHFEHNFGHGERHLASVLATLMLLAFALDQLQAAFCPLFQAAMQKEERPLYFWQSLRAMHRTLRLPSWQVLYECLAYGYETPVPKPINTS